MTSLLSSIHGVQVIYIWRYKQKTKPKQLMQIKTNKQTKQDKKTKQRKHNRIRSETKQKDVHYINILYRLI